MCNPLPEYNISREGLRLIVLVSLHKFLVVLEDICGVESVNIRL